MVKPRHLQASRSNPDALQPELPEGQEAAEVSLSGHHSLGIFQIPETSTIGISIYRRPRHKPTTLQTL